MESYTFLRIFPFLPSCPFYWHKLLIVVFYDPLYFCVVCCDFSIFISNFVDLILLPFLFFLNFILFLNLKHCICFAKHQNESATGIHVLPILKPPPSFLLPPHSIPLGRPSVPAPSIQYRASNLDWQLVSYMILHMFQCHSPKSSHPLPLQQSP